LLPVSPAAAIGSAIHSLLEEAGKGALPGINDISSRWEKLVDTLNEKLSKSWLDSYCVPLSKTVRDYDFKKLRAIRKAAEIHSTMQLYDNVVAASRHELWVQSGDGFLGGAIDIADVTAEGTVLRDYKSGQIYEGDEIKPAYKLQLKLYAALYKEMVGEWPIALQIEPLKGQSVDVPFTRDECTALFVEALSLFHEINQQVSSLQGETTHSESMRSLANPSRQVCQFCQFRPVCGPYLRERRAERADDWPADMLGKVIEITALKNGKLLIGIEDSHGATYLRGVTNSVDRHPALAFLKLSDWIGVFGVMRSPAADTFSESVQTVIYKYLYDP